MDTVSIYEDSAADNESQGKNDLKIVQKFEITTHKKENNILTIGKLL